MILIHNSFFKSLLASNKLSFGESTCSCSKSKLYELLKLAENFDLDLKDYNLDTFLQSLISSKTYKKNKPIIQLIYSFIEVYFRNNISTENIKLFHLYHYFLKKINDTKIYNLDEETLFMEFEDKVLNG